MEKTIATNFSETGAAMIEVGFNTKELWTSVYPKYYESNGIHATAAIVDVFVRTQPGQESGIGNVQIAFEKWKAYVDAARRDGIKVVAPITGLVSGLGAHGQGPFRGPFGADGRVKPDILAEYERMAEYGDGIALDDPVNFTYWQYPVFQNAIVSLIRWAKDRHLSVIWIVSPGGVKNPVGSAFREQTQKVIDLLASQNALPTDFAVENYLAPGNVPPGYPNPIAPDSNPDTEAGVAVWLAHYLASISPHH
jgi:hypothetical protein